MTIDELWRQIEAAGKQHDYVLRDRAMPESQPSSMTVVEPAADDSGRWVVYFSERGQILNPRYYENEDAACQAVLAQVTAPPPPKVQLTPEQEAHAAQRKVELEERRREMMRAAGIDPDKR